MIVACGTSIPTSITLVASSTSISPARKLSMIAAFSFGFMRPCTSPSRNASSGPLARASSVLEMLASSRFDSSTAGTTT